MADKRLFLTIYLIITVWLLWMMFVLEPAKKDGAEEGAPRDPLAVAADPLLEEKQDPAEPKAQPTLEEAPVEIKDSIALGTAEAGESAPYFLEAILTNRGAGVREMYLNRYVGEDRTSRLKILSQDESPDPSYLVSFAEDDTLRTKPWKLVESTPSRVVFETTAEPTKGKNRGRKVALRKEFQLEPGKKVVQLVLEFKNLSDQPLEKAHYTMTGGTGVPLEGKWYTRYYRNAVFLQRAEGSSSGSLTEEPASNVVDNFNQNRTQVAFTTTPVQFFGVTSQYFASLVVQPFDISAETAKNQISQASAAYVSQDSAHPEMSNVGVEGRSVSFDLAPGESIRHEYILFNGPKEEHLLDEFSTFRLRDVIHYPPFIFIPVSFFSQVLTGTLEFFYTLVKDYGIAIILLTVVVRVCLFPLNWWQTHAMAKMQAIAPLMERIRRETGDDMQEYGRRMRELNAKFNVNPYMGCLPALIQLPIMVGLWQGLATDFHLRHAPFLFGTTWIDDLSAPDMLAPWPIQIGFINNLLGPYFNLLPIISLVQLILVMMMNMPKTTSPEAQLQRRVMIGMMIMMSFMFYKVPSGLCIYIITGSLWGMIERKLMPKPELPPQLKDLSEQAKQEAIAPSKEPESWKKPLDAGKKKTARK